MDLIDLIFLLGGITGFDSYWDPEAQPSEKAQGRNGPAPNTGRVARFQTGKSLTIIWMDCGSAITKGRDVCDVAGNA